MKNKRRVLVVLFFGMLFMLIWISTSYMNRMDNNVSSGPDNEAQKDLSSSGETIAGKVHSMPNLLDNEEIARAPLRADQQDNVVQEYIPRIGLQRLILIDSDVEQVMASFTRNRTDREFALFPYFKFHDYYILDDHVYYIFSENGYIYMGSSLKKADGAFARKREELLISDGLMRLSMPYKRFVAPQNEIPLRIELGDEVEYKIYELNSSGEFELKESKLSPRYNYDIEVPRLSKNNLPSE